MTRPTDYDLIADEYAEAKKQPWRSQVEDPSFMKAIGDVRGLRVVDIACGEGHHTRNLRRAGADVVGFDMSAKMIELARAEEAKDPLGIDYRVENVTDPGPPLDYDLAVAAWLLVYCRTRAELDRYCQAIARRIRAGGRFVTFTTNNEIYHTRHGDYRRYGFTIELLDDEPREGSIMRWRPAGDSRDDLVVDNYYLGNRAYREALQRAGFVDVTYHWPSLAPGADPGYWEEFLLYPVAFSISATKR